MLPRTIDEFGFGQDAERLLQANSIFYIDDLVLKLPADLRALEGMSEEILEGMREKLAAHGLVLGMYASVEYVPDAMYPEVTYLIRPPDEKFEA